jgi:hypothetical protein
MRRNASGFGWENPAWARQGGRKPEAWHWVYIGSATPDDTVPEEDYDPDSGSVLILVRTSPGLIWAVDHGSRTKWRVPSATIRDWLKAQGAVELSGLQPAAYLNGYRDISS